MQIKYSIHQSQSTRLFQNEFQIVPHVKWSEIEADERIHRNKQENPSETHSHLTIQPTAKATSNPKQNNNETTTTKQQQSKSNQTTTTTLAPNLPIQPSQDSVPQQSHHHSAPPGRPSRNNRSSLPSVHHQLRRTNPSPRDILPNAIHQGRTQQQTLRVGAGSPHVREHSQPP